MRALSSLRQVAADGAVPYLSASGLDSELGDGYEGQGIDLSRRFAMVRQGRARDHAILGPGACPSPSCSIEPKQCVGAMAHRLRSVISDP